MNTFAQTLRIISIFLLTLYAANSWAQYDFDEEVDEDTGQFQMFGAIQLRADFVRDLPRPVESNFERGLARGIIGIIWEPTEVVEVGAAVKANLNTDSNDESRFNLDNERADDFSLDELYVNFRPFENTELLLGQTRMPLELGPMVWDQDLRPQGVTLKQRLEIGEFSSFELIGGKYLGNHEYGDESRILGLQGALHVLEGAPLSFDLFVSYLDFDNLDEAARNGLRRTNRPGPNGLLNDFDILDFQLGLNYNKLAFPISLKLDLLTNLTAGDENDAARADIILGNSFRQKGFELGYAYERIQRDAIVAAFSDDNWWFASWLRGSSVWFGYGFNDSMRIKVAGFFERRDDQDDYNKRVLVDLEYFF